MKDHIDILNEKGTVWWGIVGNGMSMKIIKEIENQLLSGVETKTILISSDKGKIDYHTAKILEIKQCENGQYPVNKTDLIPKYYSEQSVLTWLKLSNIEKVDESIKTKYRLQSKPNQDLPVIFRGRSSIMYIVDYKY